ncbi:hypothetical protein KSS87_015617 [Heliosperma pusillum]|nr:hypothetical protein KSS87_015617 [Heliosperma pusillum]
MENTITKVAVLTSTQQSHENQESKLTLSTKSRLPVFYRDEEDRASKLAAMEGSPFHRLLSLEGSKERSMPEAAMILGMPDEGEDVASSRMVGIPSYYRDMADKANMGYGTSLADVESVLKNTVLDEGNKVAFKKVMHYYLVSFVVYTNADGKEAINNFSLVDDIPKFERTNWVKVMVNHIYEKIEAFVKAGVWSGRRTFPVYTPLLEAWFYLRTSCTVDTMIKDFPHSAPIEYYHSDNRLTKVTENLDANHLHFYSFDDLSWPLNNHVNSTLIPCEMEEMIEETSGYVYKSFDMENTVVLEKHGVTITGDMGCELVDHCLEEVMPYAATLG